MTPFSFLFWTQPIDVILYQLLLWFGWVPIAATLVHGFIILFQDTRRGKYKSNLRFVLLAIDAPLMTEQSPKAMENFFSNLAGAYTNFTWKEQWIIGKVQGEFAFELVSAEGRIQYYVRTQTRWRDTIEAGIYAHYPDAEITEVEDYTVAFPSKFPDPTYQAWGAELRLKEPDYYPIRTYVDFEDRMTQEIKDPLGHILEQLSRIRPGEHFWIQIVLQVTNNDWKKPGISYLKELYGNVEEHAEGIVTKALKGVLTLPGLVTEELTGVNISHTLLGGGHAEGEEEDPWKFFRVDPTMKEKGEGVLKKISKVGHNVKIRMVYIARKEVYNKLARTAYVKGMYNQFAHLSMNGFGLSADTIPKDDYFWQRWVYTKKQTKLITAYKKRDWGMGANPFVLNAEELATIWHFPAVGVKTPFIHRTESRRAEPPITLPVGGDDEPLELKEKFQGAIPPSPFDHLHGEEIVHVEPTKPVEDIHELSTPDVHLSQGRPSQPSAKKSDSARPPHKKQDEPWSPPPNLPV